MLLTIFNVFYILIAVAMVALILLQRGAGADAGSGFGSGASATVFGARGSANFLSRATAVLAGLFFLLSLGMGMYLGRGGIAKPQNDLGIMSGVEVPAAPATTAPAAASPASDVPQAPVAAPAAGTETPAVPQPATPAVATKADDKTEAKADESKKN
ncbi:protein translocase subunit secG [Tahibacter aquaticus]|uniref:Protein-export membrane protein SecG n=1 Tax=Tahibacter aquaticus TaxID=520092 RepID=A0A4R6YP86_9GAMM|nr:preprotein translocase subunit SecG [Tahibacter aquaticus]TDR39446.1 protein translocase subunit secG [Tahibacter aquaticus]